MDCHNITRCLNLWPRIGVLDGRRTCLMLLPDDVPLRISHGWKVAIYLMLGDCDICVCHAGKCPTGFIDEKEER